MTTSTGSPALTQLTEEEQMFREAARELPRRRCAPA
jgi:hypothetical protein